LIIVVLMGVHLRGGFSRGSGEPAPALSEPAPVAFAEVASAEPAKPAIEETTDPETRKYETEVVELQGRLLETLRSLDLGKESGQRLQRQQAAVAERQATARRLLERHEQELATHRQGITQAQEHTPPLRERLDKLQLALKEIEARPPERRLLRVHLPVSRPVDAEELIFECQGGRVTFADLQALLQQVQQELPQKGEELRSRWSVTDKAGPVGAFELRYVVERERGSSLDQLGLPPAEERQFRYGLGKWELIPVWPVRGDPAADALKDGSRFRTVVDAIDPEQVVLTFFVYPDSFELFRELRDYLHERGFVVAGRPLPPGYAIYGSKTGSVSRGQ